jgi:oxygen-dependent protoporphyrinogen oxidase
MIWTSTLCPDHAPRGKISLRAMVGGARDPGAASESPSELEGRVVRELGPLIGLRAPPVSTRVFRYSLGLPQYHVGHAARLEAIAARLAESPGIYLTGNAYRGVGINDLTRDARAIAESVARDLDQRR